MGKCCSKIKVKPALESATETDTKSTGWIRRITNALCMGKHSVAVEPCVIKEDVDKNESGHKQPAEDDACVIQETIVKSESGHRQPAEDDACDIQETIVKSESGHKQPAEDDACVIQETIVKSESGHKQPAEDDACVIQETIVKSESGHKQPAEDDACVIQEAVVKSECGLKQLAEDNACVIQEAVVKSKSGLKQLTEDNASVIQEAVVKSESGLKQLAEEDDCVIQETVVKSECGLKQLAEDNVCVIQEAVVKSEFGLQQLAEDDACVIQKALVKSESGLKQLAKDDACIIQEAIVKSESGHSQESGLLVLESQMIGIDELPRVAQTPKMDFAIYLLPPSPPASNLGLPCLAVSPEAARCEEEQQEIADKDFSYEGCVYGVNLDQNGHYRANLRKHGQGIKPIIVKRDATTSDSETSETSADSWRVTPPRPSSSKSSTVSFADDKGFALATVHIMTEPSDEPPCIAADDNWSFTNGIEPPYKLAFSQPAADYVAFREKVDRCRVSLENVILSGYQVQGTINVKNICLEKRVFVRVTFDSWVTSQDVEAKYAQPYAGNSVHSYDTFSFEFEINTRSDTNQKVQFAVCFETPTGQHWDNNSGANYEIIPFDNADCF